MSEQQQNGPQFGLQRIYVKDLSFESPNPAEFFAKKNLAPEINLQMNITKFY